MSELNQLYQALILQHAKEKHGEGLRTPSGPVVAVRESRQYNPLCGDEVTLRVAVGPGEDGVATVADVSWAGEGCSISQAATSTLHDLVVGRPVTEADEVADAFRTMIRSRGELEPDEEVLGDAVAFQGVGRHANRVKCAMLGWTAFEDALHRAVASTDDATTEEKS
jgi:nitrogen fixation NifU-like protein